MLVYQYDHAGILLGPVEADPSPLEPGKYLIPARCTKVAPPAEVPSGHVPRWNGAGWHIVRMPMRPTNDDPVAKLREFLAANPDVADLINSSD